MSVQYRADHVGSFLRSPELLDARRTATNSVDDQVRLRSLENAHILRALKKQQELGFDIFTDGELRRRNFMSDFTDAVAGFDMGDAVDRSWNAGQAQHASVSNVAGVVTSRLRKVRALTGHELVYLKADAPGAIKMTLPSATQFPAIAFKRGVSDKVYENHSALLWDMVE